MQAARESAQLLIANLRLPSMVSFEQHQKEKVPAAASKPPSLAAECWQSGRHAHQVSWIA